MDGACLGDASRCHSGSTPHALWALLEQTAELTSASDPELLYQACLWLDSEAG